MNFIALLDLLAFSPGEAPGCQEPCFQYSSTVTGLWQANPPPQKEPKEQTRGWPPALSQIPTIPGLKTLSYSIPQASLSMTRTQHLLIQK